MLISLDRTGFPLVAIEQMALEVHLLPITKIQFEPFVADSEAVNQTAYLSMLVLNPAIDPAEFTAEGRERLFIGGTLPEETLAFARWLGQGFDLPTTREWRLIYRSLRRMALPRHRLSSVLDEGPARLIVDKLASDSRAFSMLDLSLMNGGLVEWVQAEPGWAGLGAPRPSFHANLWDPLTNLVRPIRPDERLAYFGFRLVRRDEWYLSGEGRARYID